jgi:F-type H+-transporting ATPase subunit gamma
MESLQNVKARRSAVKNVGQITKAMEVVSTTKMRRAQEIALNSRPYSWKALELLKRISKNKEITHPFFTAKPAKKTLLILVASDKGLTGSFNTQVLRKSEEFLKEEIKNGKSIENFSTITIGKKSLAFAIKKKIELVENISGAGDYASIDEVENISKVIIRGFENEEWDKVITISTHFRTALKQEVLIRQILPIDFSKIESLVKEIVPEKGLYAEEQNQKEKPLINLIDYILEPDPETALSSLIPHLVKMQIYHLILEANASEHSARRVAMKTASDNAEELVENLTIIYNKARQAKITGELIEITSTQNALK